MFVHDDFKITQKLTLNLGIRYEFFTAMVDPQDRLSRFLDLNIAIPEFQGARAPQMPASVTALRTAPPIYNGAWVFTDSENRGSWNAPKGLFMPRVGIAYRANDKTAIRIGWARYIVPATLTDGLNILGSVPLPGFDANTSSIGNIQGVPQQRVNNPFPGGLVAVVGKSLGRYTNLGNPTTWYQQNFNPGVNDRFNISVQRQLPGRVLADITYFMNLGRNAAYNYDINQIDPRIGYARGTATTASVANPFFNILGADKMPGQLRTQRNIATNQLLRPYPQYGSLVETLRGGGENRYRALQMQFQRPFVNGFNMVIGYNYNRERNLEFYDEQDNFLHNFTWQPATNARHRLTGAGIYQMPFGKGRKYMSAAPRGVEMVLGGWGVTGLFTYNTGLYLRFGGMVVNGDPGVSSPTKSQWFDTSKFAVLPAFTRRSNPLQYDSVKGPNTANVDLTLAKEFPITERVKFELRLEGYNVANSFFGNNPSTDVRSPVFGQIVQQRPGFFGRQLQYTGRIYF
jgi:hypothetical protein